MVDHTQTPPPGPVAPSPEDPIEDFDRDSLLQDPEADAESEKPRDRVGIIGLVLAIIAALLIVLLLRGCDAPGGRAGDATRSIVPVEGLHPDPGMVSVWVKSGSSIESVLREAGVRSEETIDLGDGRYAVRVEPGTESDAARRMKESSLTYDAGLVYEDAPLTREDVETDAEE